MGVDAIRVDTLKHVERNNMLQYVDAWRAHKPSVFVFGENLVKGAGFGTELTNDNASAVIRPWWYTRRATNPADPRSGPDSGLSVLDFPLFSTFRDNLSHGHFGGVGGVLGWDWVYGDATKLVLFLQNHDVGPDNDFKYRFNGDRGWRPLPITCCGRSAASPRSITARRSSSEGRAAGHRRPDHDDRPDRPRLLRQQPRARRPDQRHAVPPDLPAHQAAQPDPPLHPRAAEGLR